MKQELSAETLNNQPSLNYFIRFFVLNVRKRNLLHYNYHVEAARVQH